MMKKVTQVIKVKSNFREQKPFFHLLQTFHHYLPVTQYNAVNRLRGTETTKLNLGELSG